MKVLKTNDIWYGMTYKEDVGAVRESFRKMLEDGVYKACLFRGKGKLWIALEFKQFLWNSV